MVPERERRVLEVLQGALGREPWERPGFLAEACAGDDSLREEVEELLSHDEKAGGFIEEPPFRADFTSADNSPELPLDRSLGPYRIDKALGEGGMGVVYLAYDTKLKRRVALKLLLSQFTNDRDRVGRFRQEAFAASSLNHPNILTIHDVGQAEGTHYIVTEFVDGVTLRDHMSNAGMSVAAVLHVITQIASALKVAHAAGIVHRDIKPENVMIRRDDGIIKVLDFGLAKLVEQPRENSQASTPFRTRPGVFVGTPNYMSPEQVTSAAVDARSDLFSLGAVLYECVTAKRAFPGENVWDVWRRIEGSDPPSPSTLNPNVPRDLDRITMMLLAKQPEARYQSAGDLIEDLEALRDRINIRGKTPTISERPKRFLDRLRLPSLRITIFALILMFVTVAVMFFLRQGPEDSATTREMQVTPLTNSGKSVCAAISPDGKYVAHVTEDGENQTLFVSRYTTASSLTLLPAGKVNYTGLTFSSDGDYLYFVRYEADSVGKLYKVPALGGPPEKLVEDVDSPITLSPDGKKLAFVRLSKNNDTYHLVVVDTNSLSETIRATREGGARLSTNGLAWSPDGKRLVFGASSWDGGFHTDLMQTGADGGAESRIPTRRWFVVLQIAWLPEGNKLIVGAAEQPTSPFQLWSITYPNGEAEKITSDVNDYDGVSLTANASKIVSVKRSQTSKIWVGSVSDISQAKPVADLVGASFGLTWAPQGRIVFSTMSGKNLNIFVMNVDGSEKRQLTVNAGDNYHPAISADGRYIFFASNRTGTFNIWRMNVYDGSGQKQITNGGGDFYPYCSPDNKWVIYEHQSSAVPTIWKAPFDGGSSEQLTNRYSSVPVASPDNKFIACRYFIRANKRGIAILPLEGGAPVKLLPIPIVDNQKVIWTSKQRALSYMDVSGGNYNIWRQPIEGGRPEKVTNFVTDQIFTYDWSPDEKQMACQRGIISSDVIEIANFR